ncbi:hypothetical protein SAMN05421755_101539 [Nitrosomonas sp. Nm33]|nr:hypothetical protein SAMN05421755_101539 [Nitrosomonas sp. Nm33]
MFNSFQLDDSFCLEMITIIETSINNIMVFNELTIIIINGINQFK